MCWRRRKKILLTLVTMSLISTMVLLPKVQAANNPQLMTKIDLSAPIEFQDAGNKIYNFQESEISLKKLLRTLAGYGNINILLDKSVEGNVSVSFNDITVREALEYVRNIAGLYYVNKGDNIILVTTKESAQEKGLTKNISKIIPIRYVNAKLVAALLNNTIFNASSQDAKTSDTSKKATAEFRTNTIILVGTDNDIRLAEDLIEKVDIPRESKTFTINHAQSVEVAQLLQATVFNDGISPFNATGVVAGATDLPANPSTVSVDVETFEEGSGSATEVQGAAAQTGGGTQQTFTLRKTVMNTKDIKVAPDGPIIVPDSRTNTLTIMGTVEQIALAESIIPNLDQKLPQVAIETSLVEIFENGARELKPIIGTDDGQFAFGFNDTVASVVPSAGTPDIRALLDAPNIIGLPTARDKGKESSAFAWTTAPIQRNSQFLAQIDAVISARKAKMLANPTVIAVHNTEAIISITEEIVKSTQVTHDASGFTQTQVEIGEAGIILNIVPKVSGDGYVSLRIRPSVSTVANQITDSLGNRITLLNRRDMAVQEVRVANGQTLALGGLILESDISSAGKIPGIADIPLLGALFRTSYKDTKRSELIMLVTPRIMDDANPLAPARISSLMNKPEFKTMLGTSKRKFNDNE